MPDGEETESVSLNFGDGVSGESEVRLSNANDVWGSINLLTDQHSNAEFSPRNGDPEDGETKARSVNIIETAEMSVVYSQMETVRSNNVQYSLPNVEIETRYIDGVGSGEDPWSGYPETHFIVDAGSVNAIESGDDVILEMSGDVTNIGGAGGSQTIVIEDTTNNNVLRSTPQALNPGESTTVGATYDPDDLNEEMTFRISSDDDSDTMSWGGEDELSYFGTWEIDVDGSVNDPVERGGEFNLNTIATHYKIYTVELDDGTTVRTGEWEETNEIVNNPDNTHHEGDAHHFGPGNTWDVVDSVSYGETAETCVVGKVDYDPAYPTVHDETTHNHYIDYEGYRTYCFEFEIEEDDEDDEEEDDYGDDDDDCEPWFDCIGDDDDDDDGGNGDDGNGDDGNGDTGNGDDEDDDDGGLPPGGGGGGGVGPIIPM